MKNQYLNSKFSDIDAKFKKARKFSKNNPEIAAMLSSYLVVSISGVFEDCVEHLFIERVRTVTSDNEIVNLIKELIGQRFRNPNYKEIKGFLGYLDPNYERILDSKINEKNEFGLNSIVTNKNQVAHGGISNATIQDVETYYKDALKIFKELENILL
jgi:hypothetical protein